MTKLKRLKKCPGSPKLPKLCDCEAPGRFHCGVPGVLAHLVDGKVCPDCRVERCDSCRRYESDAAAVAKLRELGMFAASDRRSLAPAGAQQIYSVHCFANVRVKLPGILAASPREAARQAARQFNWDRHQGQAEFDDISEYLVDRDGDEDFSGTVCFDAAEVSGHRVDQEGERNEIPPERRDRLPWLLVITSGSNERTEICSTYESGFRLLYQYVEEQWEATFGEEPIDADQETAVERFFDVGPVSYTLEERMPL